MASSSSSAAKDYDLAREVPIFAHLDLDCFYCQVEHRRLGIPTTEPLAVRQWESVIAVNYPARRLGIRRGTPCSLIQRKFPHVHLVHVDVIRLNAAAPSNGSSSSRGSSATSSNAGSSRAVWAGSRRDDADSCIAFIDDGATRRRDEEKISLSRYRHASDEVLSLLLDASSSAAVVERASIDEVYIDLTPVVARVVASVFAAAAAAAEPACSAAPAAATGTAGPTAAARETLASAAATPAAAAATSQTAAATAAAATFAPAATTAAAEAGERAAAIAAAPNLPRAAFVSLSATAAPPLLPMTAAIAAAASTAAAASLRGADAAGAAAAATAEESSATATVAAARPRVAAPCTTAAAATALHDDSGSDVAASAAETAVAALIEKQKRSTPSRCSVGEACMSSSEATSSEPQAVDELLATAGTPQQNGQLRVMPFLPPSTAGASGAAWEETLFVQPPGGSSSSEGSANSTRIASSSNASSSIASSSHASSHSKAAATPKRSFTPNRPEEARGLFGSTSSSNRNGVSCSNGNTSSSSTSSGPITTTSHSSISKPVEDDGGVRGSSHMGANSAGNSRPAGRSPASSTRSLAEILKRGGKERAGLLPELSLQQQLLPRALDALPATLPELLDPLVLQQIARMPCCGNCNAARAQLQQCGREVATPAAAKETAAARQRAELHPRTLADSLQSAPAHPPGAAAATGLQRVAVAALSHGDPAAAAPAGAPAPAGTVGALMDPEAFPAAAGTQTPALALIPPAAPMSPLTRAHQHPAGAAASAAAASSFTAAFGESTVSTGPLIHASAAAAAGSVAAAEATGGHTGGWRRWWGKGLSTEAASSSRETQQQGAATAAPERTRCLVDLCTKGVPRLRFKSCCAEHQTLQRDGRCSNGDGLNGNGRSNSSEEGSTKGEVSQRGEAVSSRGDTDGGSNAGERSSRSRCSGGDARRSRCCCCCGFSEVKALWLLVGAAALYHLRKVVLDKARFTMSGAVATKKFLAKVASSRFKPQQQVLLPPESTACFLGPMPLRSLNGLRQKRGARVAAAFPHHRLVRDLLLVPPQTLRARLGPEDASFVYNLIRGEVEGGDAVKGNLRVKSMLAFKSFPTKSWSSGGKGLQQPISPTHASFNDWLVGLCAELQRRTEREFYNYSRVPKTLTLYYRTAAPDFQQFSRATPLLRLPSARAARSATAAVAAATPARRQRGGGGAAEAGRTEGTGGAGIAAAWAKFSSPPSSPFKQSHAQGNQTSATAPFASASCAVFAPPTLQQLQQAAAQSLQRLLLEGPPLQSCSKIGLAVSDFIDVPGNQQQQQKAVTVATGPTSAPGLERFFSSAAAVTSAEPPAKRRRVDNVSRAKNAEPTGRSVTEPAVSCAGAALKTLLATAPAPAALAPAPAAPAPAVAPAPAPAPAAAAAAPTSATAAAPPWSRGLVRRVSSIGQLAVSEESTSKEEIEALHDAAAAVVAAPATPTAPPATAPALAAAHRAGEAISASAAAGGRNLISPVSPAAAPPRPSNEAVLVAGDVVANISSERHTAGESSVAANIAAAAAEQAVNTEAKDPASAGKNWTSAVSSGRRSPRTPLLAASSSTAAGHHALPVKESGSSSCRRKKQEQGGNTREAMQRELQQSISASPVSRHRSSSSLSSKDTSGSAAALVGDNVAGQSTSAATDDCVHSHVPQQRPGQQEAAAPSVQTSATLLLQHPAALRHDGIRLLQHQETQTQQQHQRSQAPFAVDDGQQRSVHHVTTETSECEQRRPKQQQGWQQRSNTRLSLPLDQQQQVALQQDEEVASGVDAETSSAARCTAERERDAGSVRLHEHEEPSAVHVSRFTEAPATQAAEGQEGAIFTDATESSIVVEEQATWRLQAGASATPFLQEGYCPAQSDNSSLGNTSGSSNSDGSNRSHDSTAPGSDSSCPRGGRVRDSSKLSSSSDGSSSGDSSSSSCAGSSSGNTSSDSSSSRERSNASSDGRGSSSDGIGNGSSSSICGTTSSSSTCANGNGSNSRELGSSGNGQRRILAGMSTARNSLELDEKDKERGVETKSEEGDGQIVTECFSAGGVLAELDCPHSVASSTVHSLPVASPADPFFSSRASRGVDADACEEEAEELIVIEDSTQSVDEATEEEEQQKEMAEVDNHSEEETALFLQRVPGECLWFAEDREEVAESSAACALRHSTETASAAAGRTAVVHSRDAASESDAATATATTVGADAGSRAVTARECAGRRSAAQSHSVARQGVTEDSSGAGKAEESTANTECEVLVEGSEGSTGDGSAASDSLQRTPSAREKRHHGASQPVKAAQTLETAGPSDVVLVEDSSPAQAATAGGPSAASVAAAGARVDTADVFLLPNKATAGASSAALLRPSSAATDACAAAGTSEKLRVTLLALEAEGSFVAGSVGVSEECSTGAAGAPQEDRSTSFEAAGEGGADAAVAAEKERVPACGGAAAAVEEERAEALCSAQQERAAYEVDSPSEASPATRAAGSPSAAPADTATTGAAVRCLQCDSVVPLNELQIHLDAHLAEHVFQETNPKCLLSALALAEAETAALPATQQLPEKHVERASSPVTARQHTLDHFLLRRPKRA